jgi:hypothetical protein
MANIKNWRKSFLEPLSLPSAMFDGIETEHLLV